MINKLEKDNQELMNGIYKLINKSPVPNGMVIGDLEIIKTDLILNTGCVHLNNKFGLIKKENEN